MERFGYSGDGQRANPPWGSDYWYRGRITLGKKGGGGSRVGEGGVESSRQGTVVNSWTTWIQARCVWTRDKPTTKGTELWQRMLTKTLHPRLSCPALLSVWDLCNSILVHWGKNKNKKEEDLKLLLSLLLVATPTAYGSSQARGRIGAAAAGLHHSHSNVGSEPQL